jgi:undecaprenyl diphosphate synthase
MSVKDAIDCSVLPMHVAIIMDGNGRWAEEKGQDRLIGHINGVESVRNVVEGASEIGIQYLTLYAFSKENWDRPQYEVDGLMEWFIDTIKKEIPVLNKNNIRLHFVGDLEMLPSNAHRQLQESINETSVNTGLNLIIALSYGSRWEIADSARRLAIEVKAGNILPENITEELFHQFLITSAFPDPELMIRTSGEYRISNFLLYQLAYAELFFTNVLWPDFRKENLYEAIVDYQKRERRFGKTGKQVKQEQKK